ncbi:MAG TPA: cytochrome P450 [Pseudonocardia sp.]|jgi:cytochrome P450|nr:cytochrome P450 [Pseudonocardia sp.]
MGRPVPAFTPDLFADDVLLDPYPHYRQLRDLGPLVWLEAQQVYVLPRYEEVRAALRDAETYRSGRGVGLNDLVNERGRGTTLASDGRAHDVQRQLLFGPLTPKSLVPLRASVERLADDLVAGLVARGECDAVADLARALPLTVVPDLVGWPAESRANLLPWAAAGFDVLGPMNGRAQRALPAFGELLEFTGQVASKEGFAPDGVGARLLAAARRGEIAPEQVGPLVLDYLVPSMDTTISAIGSAVWLFARHSEQWSAVRAEPELIPRAFNEVLRLESPIRCFSRVTTRETTVGEHTLPAGARVVLHYASANRDERCFTAPDEFDVRRENVGGQLGFGLGTHNCAGQGLARIEAHAVLAALARRVARISAGEPVRGLNNLINHLTALPVTLHPAAERAEPAGPAASPGPPTRCPV